MNLKARFVTVADKQGQYSIEIEHVGTFVVPEAIQNKAESSESFAVKSNEDKLYNLLRVLLSTTQEIH